MTDRTDFKTIDICRMERWEGGRLVETVEFQGSDNRSAYDNANAYVRESEQRRLHPRTDHKIIDICRVERLEGGRLVETVDFHGSYNMSPHSNAGAYMNEQRWAEDEQHDAHVRAYHRHIKTES